MSNAASAAHQGWSDLLAQLELLATATLGDEFGDLTTEQLDHLVEQVIGWLTWEVFHADPKRPAFDRHNDLIFQWGGPNADNVYRHARIEAGGTYRIRGRMHSCDRFLLAVRKGFMHNEVWGTVAQLSSGDLGIGPGDDFELTLGGDGSGPNHIELDPEAVMVSVREYYWNWVADEPATFVIERIDQADPEPPITPEVLGARLARAGSQIEDSIRYWVRYMNDHRAQRTPNRFAAGMRVAKGLPIARYSFCFWELEPDQALVVESDIPAADYWGLQLYRMGTFELVDPFTRITSRNHRQLMVGADEQVRVVLAPVDTGEPNWLDTAGRREGLCTLRWFWPENADDVEAATRVVSIDELLERRAEVSPAERAAELAERQAHLRWRFRT